MIFYVSKRTTLSSSEFYSIHCLALSKVIQFNFTSVTESLLLLYLPHAKLKD